MTKILVVNVNWLGDVLFTIPALKAIKQSAENIHLAVALPPRCRRMLEFNPHVDEIIEFDERSKQRSLSKRIKFVREIKKKQFDKVIFFHRSSTRVILFFLAQIPRREGYERKKTKPFLTKRVSAPGKDSMNKAEYFLSLVNDLGYPLRDRRCEFFVTRDELTLAENLLKPLGITAGEQKLITLHPGANWTPKRWPLEHYIKLIRLLSDWDNAINFLIVGTEKDKTLAMKIKKAFPSKNKIFQLCGETSLGTLGAVFLASDIVVSGDSGPLHISCAAEPLASAGSCKQRLTIGIYGPTSHKLTGPLNGRVFILEGKRKYSCSLPCYNWRCATHSCIYSVSPEQVYEICKNNV